MTTRIASTSSMDLDGRGDAGGIMWVGRLANSVGDFPASNPSCFENNCLLKLHPRGLLGRLAGCACEEYEVPEFMDGARNIPLICS